jgi:hypothetical protein
MQETNGADPWLVACTSPCDVDLPVGPNYRIEGEALKPSATFIAPECAARHGHRAWRIEGTLCRWHRLRVRRWKRFGRRRRSADVQLGLSPLAEQPSSFSVPTPFWLAMGGAAAVVATGMGLILANAKTMAALHADALQQATAAASVRGRSDLARGWTGAGASPTRFTLPPAIGVPLWTGRF